MVGFGLILQHTPRCEIDAPPLSVTLPPLVAVVSATGLTGDVVTTGTVTVTKLNSSPYPVPELFVAYALT